MKTRTRSSRKIQRSLSRNRASSHLRRSERLGNRSKYKAKLIGERARSEGKIPERRVVSSYTKGKGRGSKDLEDHLGIFSAAAEQEEWHMPIRCRMFRQTLSSATSNLFDELDPKSVDSFEELSQKFKSESSHIKGVPLVLCVLAFMHGHGHPKMAKKLNDKIPKTVDKMFGRVRAFIRGEAVVGLAEVARTPQCDKGVTRLVWSRGHKRTKGRGGQRELQRNTGTCAPYSRRDMFTPLTKTPKEILDMEGVNFPPPLPLIGTSEKQNLNKFCDYHGDKGHNTNECFHLKKQI
ncbi:hypothetical protein Tco_1185052 [Tanacetum coccineum]